MQSFLKLVALGFVSGEVDQHGGEVGIPLKSVLGAIEEPVLFSRWAESSRADMRMTRLNVEKSSKYAELRHPDKCVFPLDIVILQDLTDSFDDNIDEMRNTQLKLMINGLASSHPNSRFAVVGFQDKPIWKMGNRDDACWLFSEDFTGDFETIYDTYSKFKCYGGADAPENQFGAISAALGTNKLNWSPARSERTKLMVVVTDAGPHHAEDGVTPADGTVLAQFSGSYTDERSEELCLKTGYPSAQAIYNLITAYQAYMAFFVFDGDWANGWAANEWKTFNKYIGQPESFVREDTANSSVFWEQLSKVITEIEKVECIEQTTPAPTPSPTTAPTPAPTTTGAIATTAGGAQTTTPAPVTTTMLGPPTMGPDATSTAILPPPVSTIIVPETQPGECQPTVIVEGDCVPAAENCYCHPDVLIRLAKKPDTLNLVADDKVVAAW